MSRPIRMYMSDALLNRLAFIAVSTVHPGATKDSVAQLKVYQAMKDEIEKIHASAEQHLDALLVKARKAVK